MSELSKREIRELKSELERIDGGGKGDCPMCRFVLIFAFVVMLLVITFTFFFKMDPGRTVNTPLSAEKALPMSPEEWNDRIVDLGTIIHPELASSTPHIQDDGSMDFNGDNPNMGMSPVRK